MKNKTIFNQILYSAQPHDINQRVDKVIAQHPHIKTRSRAAKLIEEGCVSLNNKNVKASYLVQKEDSFQISIPIIETDLQPLDMKLDIIFEDSELIVVNKPAGLVVHPGDGHHQDTLVNALIGHTHDLSMGFHEKRPGIVHRLDKDTSGLLVVAKNDFSHEYLAQQFKSRRTHRIYWALTHGKFKDLKGTIQTFLNRHPKDRKRFSSQKEGKLAITHYEMISSSPYDISLVKLKLETGRTHQIRVHMSELHHPLLGDKMYGSEKLDKKIKLNKLREIVLNMNRITLHAAELGFYHPKTEQFMEFKQDWPNDIKNLVELLELS